MTNREGFGNKWLFSQACQLISCSSDENIDLLYGARLARVTLQHVLSPKRLPGTGREGCLQIEVRGSLKLKVMSTTRHISIIPGIALVAL